MHRKVLAKTDKRQLYRCATVAGLHKDYKHDGSTKKWYYQLKLNSFNKLLRFINEERKIQMKKKIFWKNIHTCCCYCIGIRICWKCVGRY